MPIQNPWTPSAFLLMACGLSLIGIGLYFIFIRLPLLLEDARYLALPPTQLEIVRPRLDVWLTHVFRVMGGFVLATGALAVTLAATSFRRHERGVGLGALIGGSASIGLMAFTNFLIKSDFKWPLLGIALLWGVSLILFWIERRVRRVQMSVARTDALYSDNH